MEIKGTLKAISEPRKVNENLTTQTFVVGWVKTIKDKTYPKTIAFEQKKSDKYDGIKVFDNCKVGDSITVFCNEPESREWQGKYFTSIEAWKVENNSAAKPSESTASKANSDEGDFLPF